MLPLAGWVLAALAAAQSDPAAPAARWALDGTVADSGPGALPTRAAGRLEFADSPIGSAGKMAVFNGVDAYVEVDPPRTIAGGAAEFSLSAWIFPLDRRPAPLFARPAWSLSIEEGARLRFTLGAASVQSAPGACPAGQWSHLLVSVVHRGDRVRAAVLVNGEPAASGELPAAELDPAGAPLWMGKAAGEGRVFLGLMDEVRLYARELGAPEGEALVDAGIPWLRRRPPARAAFGGKFELHPEDVVSFVGSENLRAGLELGYLETLLALRMPDRHLHVRNMAWEGDTVLEQPRPINFGSWTDQFRRTGTTVIFVQFGQVEALVGTAGLDPFAAAYDALLEEFSRWTPRIVLLSPSPFGREGPRGAELVSKNAELRRYAEAVRGLAARRGFLFVDLSGPEMEQGGATRDGLHLSKAGQWTATREIARQLEIPGLSDVDAPGPGGAFPREAYEKLREAIRRKNDLWNASWRPTNWAFLNGDRIEQPSSRDHLDRRIRWFPVEVQELPALVRRQEAAIDALLRAGEPK